MSMQIETMICKAINNMHNSTNMHILNIIFSLTDLKENQRHDRGPFQIRGYWSYSPVGIEGGW